MHAKYTLPSSWLYQYREQRNEAERWNLQLFFDTHYCAHPEKVAQTPPFWVTPKHWRSRYCLGFDGRKEQGVNLNLWLHRNIDNERNGFGRTQPVDCSAHRITRGSTKALRVQLDEALVSLLHLGKLKGLDAGLCLCACLCLLPCLCFGLRSGLSSAYLGLSLTCGFSSIIELFPPLVCLFSRHRNKLLKALGHILSPRTPLM